MSDSYPVDILIKLTLRPYMIVVMIITVVMVGVMLALVSSHRYEKRFPASFRFLCVTLPGIFGGESSDQNLNPLQPPSTESFPTLPGFVRVKHLYRRAREPG